MIRRAVVLAIALVLLTSSVAFATFSDSGSIGSNSFATATLAPPTATSVTYAGANGLTINWTASTTSFTSGYNVLRATASGGPYTLIGTTSGAVTYSDPVLAGTYYYVVQATGRGWTSVNSAQASGTSTLANTGFLACGANAPVTLFAGNNNGFETNPGAACTNTATLATDANTGLNLFPPDSCTGILKDRHQFYDFGASIPAGKTIDGIEVQAALSENNTSGTTRVCAELSWNAGSSYATAKSVLLTQTAENTFILGATNDKWGRTWATTDFTDANFRLRITDSATVGGKNIMLRNLGLRVTYH
jgi:hypothetical protein